LELGLLKHQTFDLAADVFPQGMTAKQAQLCAFVYFDELVLMFIYVSFCSANKTVHLTW
jgi:hypothetical protein